MGRIVEQTKSGDYRAVGANEIPLINANKLYLSGYTIRGEGDTDSPKKTASTSMMQIPQQPDAVCEANEPKKKEQKKQDEPKEGQTEEDSPPSGKTLHPSVPSITHDAAMEWMATSSKPQEMPKSL